MIDEVDQVAAKDQYKLRQIIDDNKNNAGFIFTTNKLHNVDGGLYDRCDQVEFSALDPMHRNWRNKAREVLLKEGHRLTDDDLDKLLKQGGTSIREFMRLLEDQVLALNVVA